MEYCLETHVLCKEYGRFKALDNLTIHVPKGSIYGFVGKNGAGKTTTLRTISGVVKAKSGQVLLKDEPITNRVPYKIASLGVIQSPEGRLILNGLTVEENLKVGAYGLKGQAIRVKKPDGSYETVKMSKSQLIKYNFDKVYKLFPILQERKKQQANTLSGGEQQMLAIGRAMMSEPEFIMFDEPSLGLAPVIVKQVFKIIKEINSRGTTILLIEQNARQALGISDYTYVLENGHIILNGPSKQMLNDPAVQKAYLGE